MIALSTGTAQELLGNLLEAIYQLDVFNKTYSSKSPSVEEALLEDLLPHSQVSYRQSSSQVFDLFVKKAIDEICIIAVMVNYESISKASVFEFLFKLLNSQFNEENKDNCRAFAEKLVNASFIRVSMEVSGRFCSSGENFDLMNELQQFQRGLMINLNEEFFESEMSGEMFKFNGVPGSSNEYLSLLSQSCLDPITLNVSDRMLFNIQCYCIELLYLSYKYHDALLDEKDILQGIDKFICLNSNLHILPAQTFKQMLYLYTDAVMKYRGDQCNALAESQRIVHQELLKLNPEEFQMVSCLTSSFIQWVFESEQLTRAFGYILLRCLLVKNEESLKWNFLKTNAVKHLISLIEDRDPHIALKVAQVIESMLAEDVIKDESNHADICEVIARDIQKLFLKNQRLSLPDHVLLAMLQVLLSLQLHMSEQFDIKIFHLVIDVLTKSNKKSSDICIAATNYVNIILWRDTRTTRCSISAALLTNQDFMTWLQEAVTTLVCTGLSRADNSSIIGVISACMFLISNLVYHQCKHGISTPYTVLLNKKHLLKCLNDYHNNISQLASLFFWKNILNSNTKTFVIFHIDKDDDKGENILTEIDCKVMLVYLQNALMQESKTIRNAALACLEAFVSSTERANNCSSNPWNKVVLESLLFSLTQEKLDSGLLQFCMIMTKAKSFWNMEEPLASTAAFILRQIPDVSLGLDGHGQLPKVAVNCISLLKELVATNLPLVRTFSNTPLLTWIKDASEKIILSKTINRICFIKVGQLVISEEIELGYTEGHNPREILDILRQLQPMRTRREK